MNSRTTKAIFVTGGVASSIGKGIVAASVGALMEARGLTFGSDSRDTYVGSIRAALRRGRDPYFLDRLIAGAIVEARGQERFAILANALDDPSLRSFYHALAESEARPAGVFFALACEYFPARDVTDRCDSLLDLEAEIVERLPLRAALH